jgi:hypothetical protein
MPATTIAATRTASRTITAITTATTATNGNGQQRASSRQQRINTTSNSDFWAELKAALEAIVGSARMAAASSSARSPACS